jgi:predicted  nucleic acid-binding Zn-ribbon protein
MNITQCPKCGHQRGPLDDPEIPDTQCPACGIYYFKYLNQKSRLPTPQVSPPTAPAGSKNRISITAAQAKTEAGAQLLKLCQEVTGDAHQPPKKTSLSGYIALGLAALIIINMIDAKQNAAENAKTYADRLAQQDADCKKNLKCSAEKNISAVAGPCGRAVFKLSKYQAEWTNATTEPRLSRYRWHDQARGTITFIGDKIKFQTNFGAWQNIIYECDFDPESNKIFAVRAVPGRI